MRVKNKEIRKRRHRKEQVIKDAIREAKKGTNKAEKKVAPVEKPAAPKKVAAKKTEGEKKPAAKKSTKKADTPAE